MRTFRKSAGTLCTAPGESAFLFMDFILRRHAISLGVSDAVRIGRREKPISASADRPDSTSPVSALIVRVDYTRLKSGC